MTLGNEPINPYHSGRHNDPWYIGLTKREYFSAMAMQGLCSNHEYTKLHTPDEISTRAIYQADALILELEKGIHEK